MVELAMAIAIVGLLISTFIGVMSAGSERTAFDETQRRLEKARELLLAFAIVKRRLPCPARSVPTATPLTVAGDEVINGTGQCIGDGVEDNYGGTIATGVTGGFLPARAIGFEQMDQAGFAVDAWGNRIRYAVARNVYTETTPLVICRRNVSTTLPLGLAPLSPPFTNAANLLANNITCTPNDLVICRSALNSSTACDAADNSVTPPQGARITGPIYAPTDSTTVRGEAVVAVIWSPGKNRATGPTGTHESRNLDGAGNVNALFVSRSPDPATAAGGEFDDLVVWIPVVDLYGRMIAAGVLP